MHLNHRETDGLHLHNSPQIRHGVPETLNLNSTQLVVHREVCQVHVAGGFDCQPDAPENVTVLRDSQKLVFRGCLVKCCDLLVDEERVRDPDESDVLGPHHQLIDPEVRAIELEPVVWPELTEVHVEGKIHEFLG